jgi:SlyX protein
MGGCMSNEVIELQTQLAFQEQTIGELNEVMISQQKQIDVLRLEIKVLKEKFGVLEDRFEVGPAQSEKPPHY